MNRCFRIVMVMAFFSVFSAFAQEAPAAVGPGAQKILQLSKAGVDDSVVVSFIQSSPEPFRLSTSDIVTLRGAGVSQVVVLEAMRRDAALGVGVARTRTVTESDLFRLIYGRLYYHGKVESVAYGLSPDARSLLLSDATAAPDIEVFASLQGTSGVLSWGGLALILGGAIYGGVASAQPGTSPAVNSGITLGAIGSGVVMGLIGAITGQSAYQHLYNGLAQYNRDYIATNSAR